MLDVIAGAGVGLASILGSMESNRQNIEAQKEANAMNERLTREAWARDDNSVQRRTADLRAAGLSPTLAAGSSAGVSSPIQYKPVERADYGSQISNAASTMMSLLQSKKNIEAQDAIIQLNKAQTAKTVSEKAGVDLNNSGMVFRNAGLEIANKLADVDLAKNKFELSKAQRDFGMLQGQGLLSVTTPDIINAFAAKGITNKYVSDVGNIISKTADDLINRFKRDATAKASQRAHDDFYKNQVDSLKRSNPPANNSPKMTDEFGRKIN